MMILLLIILINVHTGYLYDPVGDPVDDPVDDPVAEPGHAGHLDDPVVDDPVDDLVVDPVVVHPIHGQWSCWSGPM